MRKMNLFQMRAVRNDLYCWNSSYPTEMRKLFLDAADIIYELTNYVFTTPDELYLLFLNKFETRLVRDPFSLHSDEENIIKIHYFRQLIAVRTSALAPIIIMFGEQMHSIQEDPSSWLGNWSMKSNTSGTSTTNYGGADTTNHGKSTTTTGSTTLLHKTTTNANSALRTEFEETTTPNSLASTDGGTTVVNYGSNKVGSQSAATTAVGTKNMLKATAFAESLSAAREDFFSFYFSEVAKLMLLDIYNN